MNRVKNRRTILREALRTCGLRMTRQRVALLKVLVEAHDHPDANQIYKRAQKLQPSLSLATVYRTLAAFQRQGLVHRHSFRGLAARFETAAGTHHDHIIDIDEGQIMEFQSPEIERIEEQIAARRGYVIVSRRLELYCRRKELRPGSTGNGPGT